MRREPTTSRSSLYYHAFNFFGRSANVTASLPYAVGNFTGELNNQQRSVYRSGLLDFGARLSVNLYGGRAMPAQDFRKWKQKVLLGASLKVIAPTGQYDPTKLINWGINRWAFKPEFGYSQRWGNWILDGYAGVWFYTTNPAYYNIPVPLPQTEAPIGSLEGHLSYDIPKFKGFRRARFWASWMATSGGAALPRSTASETSRPSKPVRASEGPLRFPLPRASRSRSPTATAPTSASAGTTRTSRSRGSIPGSDIPSRPGASVCGMAVVPLRHSKGMIYTGF